MSSNLPSELSHPGTHTTPTHNESPGDEDADVVFHLSSSFLDELREDDTTTAYTYFSTVSTNYTMSNLPGPGRLIGNFYSRAGRTLERRLGRIVNRAAIKEYEQAVVVLRLSSIPWNGPIYRMFRSEDPKEHKKVCEILLMCAR
ncbi:hypothetical protein SCHPADRAFT_515176 [Schizopora paradoxa]|uniref:Uncharacterized protein n=1 Tax=Schizopora paradoxa TaxID=27342 RepID=A0A0H2RM28_9AGAM|nr:hypothetical protein SCHPADRAFT_515176 [Schizopora paradoxa]